ncbi:hypothetical protein IGI04_034788 [Brassica rapa subsp. trilocularis]|uniref:Uncharacterized protein n=1 Tax=Brassica rapa subsp. trilocularis TaxID=1813537 RepID=A0ABQ7L9T6_BRACM|nr:hypothetical protein IGI04_034788 [Brassica rapa subsp. trilocularis]
MEEERPSKSVAEFVSVHHSRLWICTAVSCESASLASENVSRGPYPDGVFCFCNYDHLILMASTVLRLMYQIRQTLMCSLLSYRHGIAHPIYTSQGSQNLRDDKGTKEDRINEDSNFNGILFRADYYVR